MNTTGLAVNTLHKQNVESDHNVKTNNKPLKRLNKNIVLSPNSFPKGLVFPSSKQPDLTQSGGTPGNTPIKMLLPDKPIKVDNQLTLELLDEIRRCTSHLNGHFDKHELRQLTDTQLNERYLILELDKYNNNEVKEGHNKTGMGYCQQEMISLSSLRKHSGRSTDLTLLKNELNDRRQTKSLIHSTHQHQHLDSGVENVSNLNNFSNINNLYSELNTVQHHDTTFTTDARIATTAVFTAITVVELTHLLKNINSSRQREGFKRACIEHFNHIKQSNPKDHELANRLNAINTQLNKLDEHNAKSIAKSVIELTASGCETVGAYLVMTPLAVAAAAISAGVNALETVESGLEIKESHHQSEKAHQMLKRIDNDKTFGTGSISGEILKMYFQDEQQFWKNEESNSILNALAHSGKTAGYAQMAAGIGVMHIMPPVGLKLIGSALATILSSNELPENLKQSQKRNTDLLTAMLNSPECRPYLADYFGVDNRLLSSVIDIAPDLNTRTVFVDMLISGSLAKVKDN